MIDYTCIIHVYMYIHVLLPFVSMDRTHSNDSHQIQKEGVYHQHSKTQCLPGKEKLISDRVVIKHQE